MLESNLRTFENARILCLNLCQLHDMSDDELAEELRINTAKVPFKAGVKVSNNPDRNIDISKEWSTASRMEKGFSPKGAGVINTGKFS